MASLDQFLDEQLARGRGYFWREEGMRAVGLSVSAFASAVTRLVKKRRLANARHGFYLILRPEDRAAGAPNPARWIDPLMKYQGIDYRISLLHAAAFHGSSHQAAMVFQIIVPKQLRSFDIGRHRLQFVYQRPDAFAEVNVPKWLGQLKSEAGYAKVAGVELTMLDCARYFHKSAGINGVAQIVKDLGANADPQKLVEAGAHYENSAVRRLGYLLELEGHERQASALKPLVAKAKSIKPLDPSVRSISQALDIPNKKNSEWKLLINTAVEIDS